MVEATFEDADGVQVGYRSWLPDEPSGIVLVLHGASEHGGRYDWLAGVLNADGWAVYALDLRGHGRTAPATGRGIIGQRGRDGLLDDVDALRQLADDVHGDLPTALLGHSMGSLIGLGYVERSGAGLIGCVFSGSAGVVDAAATAEMAVAIRGACEAGMAEMPAAGPSPFNLAFEPARTPFDWLSRDEAMVDAFIADPDCGDDLPLTFGFVAEMIELGGAATAEAAIASIPGELPFLLLTGERDPVSNEAATVRVLEQLLRDTGHEVTAHYYPGARHEVFNEVNRSEVASDLAGWLRSLLPVGG